MRRSLTILLILFAAAAYTPLRAQSLDAFKERLAAPVASDAAFGTAKVTVTEYGDAARAVDEASRAGARLRFPGYRVCIFFDNGQDARAGAIAAKLVHPERRVLAICGDGGFMMNMQELETAKRAGTPFVALIWNDSHYGLIKWKQEEQFGKSAYVDFTNPDFKMLAESMGCRGYRIEKAGDLIPTLLDAFAQDVPAVIDCPVDYGENTRLSARLAAL